MTDINTHIPQARTAGPQRRFRVVIFALGAAAMLSLALSAAENPKLQKLAQAGNGPHLAASPGR